MENRILMYTLFAIILIIGLASYSFLLARNGLEIKKTLIKLSSLNGEIKNIAHISDLHFNNKTPDSRLDQIAEAMKKEGIATVFITGDIIDNKNGIMKAGNFVKKLTSFSRVYIVFGNWDNYVLKDNLVPLRKELEKSGAKVLVNESIKIKIGNYEFNLAGVKDPANSIDIKSYLAKALKNIDKKLPTILLAHSPEAVISSKDLNIDLILSGHTHGGQVYVPILTRMILPVNKESKKYVRGEYQEGNMAIYVNQGIGASTLPLRFLRTPEITEITLTGE